MLVQRSSPTFLAVGVLLAVVAAVVYSAGLCPGAWPGESAEVVTRAMGLHPELSPCEPLWRLVSHGLASLSGGDPVTVLNGTALVFGALAVLLVFVIAAFGLRAVLDPSVVPVSRAAWTAGFGGLVAALALMFSIPFWIASTRVYPATFHLCLLLLNFGMFLLFASSGRRVWLAVLAFSVGVAIVEFATAIVFAPMLIVWTVLLLWQREELTPGRVAIGAGFGVLGLLLYVFAAWLFHGTEGYELREFSGFWQIIWHHWREQYQLILRSLPRHGWLLVILITGVPCLTALSVGRRALNDEEGLGFAVLHLIMSACVLAVLADIPFSPWQVLGHDRLLVTPYVLIALSAGYLAAYWLLFIVTRRLDIYASLHDRLMLLIRRSLGAVFLVGVVGSVAVAPFRNRAAVDPAVSQVCRSYAEHIVDDIVPCRWVVTDGFLDSHLRLAAHKAGCDVNIVSLRGADNQAYQNYVAQELPSPRLQNLARVSLVTMLEEWLRTDTNAVAQTVLLVLPDIWLRAERSVVPTRMGYRGCPSADLALQKREPPPLAFWSETVEEFKASEDGDEFEEWIKEKMRRRLSMIANNWGYFLAEREDPRRAAECFQGARELNPENTSALLNQMALIEAGVPVAGEESIRIAFRQLTNEKETRGSRWALARTDGYVRAPQTFVQSGLVWAVSGQPATSPLELLWKADQLTPEQLKEARERVARYQLARGKTKQSAATYAKMLASDPSDTTALRGLVHTSLENGDLVRARQYLQQLKAAGGRADETALDEAVITLAEGRLADGRVMLEGLVEKFPEELAFWMLLACVAQDMNDSGRFKESLGQVTRLGGENHYYVAFMGARQSLETGDTASARRYMYQAHRKRPDDSRTLEQLIWLDLASGVATDVERDARTLLKQDPDNAVGNYAMATLRLRAKEPRLAKEALRRSLASRRLPEALNDLAWLLKEEGNYGEAAALAREAVAARDTVHEFWDTLGMVLMAGDKLDDSEEALQKAHKLAPEDARPRLHLAELYQRKKNIQRAREFLDGLKEQEDKLRPEDKKRLGELLDKMK